VDGYLFVVLILRNVDLCQNWMVSTLRLDFRVTFAVRFGDERQHASIFMVGWES
jgi:hypothetical protein